MSKVGKELVRAIKNRDYHALTNIKSNKLTIYKELSYFHYLLTKLLNYEF